MVRFSLVAVAALLVFTVGLSLQSTGSVAQAATPFTSLEGTWRGQGRLRLSNGRFESLSCRAYYTPRANGSRMGLAIRCASASNRIEIRSNLRYRGGRVSGSWIERTFNASGTVSGIAKTGRVALRIAGSITGRMSISFGGNRQSVSISTGGTGAALRNVSISLSR